jgi:flagellar FliL protein
LTRWPTGIYAAEEQIGLRTNRGEIEWRLVRELWLPHHFLLRRRNNGDDDDFEIVSNESAVGQFRSLTSAIRLGVAAISSIALIAAGIGNVLAQSTGAEGRRRRLQEHSYRRLQDAEAADVEALPDIAFVPIDQMVLSLGAAAEGRYLRFTAQLEVPSVHAGDVTLLKPRILDVLNGYLRAVDPAELEDPAALVRLRAQMLRRIQIVTGEGRVRDLLVTEFVLN